MTGGQDFEFVEGKEVRFDLRGRPIPELVDFRITPDLKLILFLKLDGYFTRQVNLKRGGAGMVWYTPAGGAFGNVVLIVRGWNAQASSVRITRNGEAGRFLYHEHHRPFLLHAARDVLERMAAQVWPVMEAQPGKRPPARFVADVQEGVQPFPRAA